MTHKPMSNQEVLLHHHVEKLVEICHSQARRQGWWTDLSSGADLTCTWGALAGHVQPPRNVGELLCLVHSEISEAMEGARKRLADDHLPPLDAEAPAPYTTPSASPHAEVDSHW